MPSSVLRKKASAVRKEVVLNVTTDDLTATDEEEDGLGSLTALSAWSTQENRTLASFQELGVNFDFACTFCT